MPLSALMRSILEQAREPLLCLHGAGYFKEEEWVQLDLIVNKEYLWTKGPKPQPKILSKNVNGTKKSRMVTKESMASTSESGGNNVSLSSEKSPIFTSPDQSPGEQANTPVSLDSTWDLSPAMTSPAPIRPTIGGQPTHPSLLSSHGKGLGCSFAQLFDMNIPNESMDKGKPQSTISSIQQKIVSSKMSEVYSSPFQKPGIHLLSPTSATSLNPVSSPAKDQKYESSGIAINNSLDDVNAFETSNAMKWDEIPVKQMNNSGSKTLNFFVENNFQNVENVFVEENRIREKVTNNVQPLSQSNQPPAENRSNQRTTTITRFIRHPPKMLKEAKNTTYIPPLPKTKTCWFWAETVGGCRYRPEECLHLHVKPKPGMLPNYPLKDGKPTWGSLADAKPQEVPPGKKPRSCWYWATKGVCPKGADCHFVHAYVVNGVASRPKRLAYDSEHSDEDTDDSSSEEEDLSGRDVGDKAPSQAANLDPRFIASRIHASEWAVKA